MIYNGQENYTIEQISFDKTIEDILAEFEVDDSFFQPPESVSEYLLKDHLTPHETAKRAAAPEDEPKAAREEDAPEDEEPLTHAPAVGIDEEAQRYMENMSSRHSAADATDEDMSMMKNYFSSDEHEAEVSFAGQRVSLAAEEDYAPTEQEGYSPAGYKPRGDSPRQEQGRKAKSRPKDQDERSRRYGEDTEGYDDRGSGGYAGRGDYGEYEDEETRRAALKDADIFPSTFGQYLSTVFASLFYRISGVGSVTAKTMEESEEELGDEMDVMSASKYYGAFVGSLRLRVRICAVLMVLMFYLAAGLPVPGMLKALKVSVAACLSIQLLIMLLSLDVVTGAFTNMLRLRLGADGLALLGCLLTTADALTVVLSENANVHMPLCLLSSISLFGVLFSSYLSAVGLRKALRVPAIGKVRYPVTGADDEHGGDITLFKHAKPLTGFVRRIEQSGPDEAMFVKAGPILLLTAVLLSAVIALVKDSASDFLFILTAILCPAVPFTALLSFTLPFALGSLMIFKKGAAIAGWSGLCDIGHSKNLVITDTDLFPEKAVKIEFIRVFIDNSDERVIAYAASLLDAAGTGSARCFKRLLNKRRGSLRTVEAFTCLPGGGLKGHIEGHTVICGGLEIMRLMNVRVPFRLVDKTSVLLAIDGDLYAIFNMKYTPMPGIRAALLDLMHSGRHPIFAVRDFNVNPEMLRNSFDLHTDGYDFPPYVERFKISEGDAADSVAGVLCLESLSCLAAFADTGNSMYRATKFNLVVTMLGAVLGMAAAFTKLLTAGCVTLTFLTVLMLAFAVPVFLACVFILLARH